jgi:uncharacterized protein (TIGR03437 family)
MTSTAPLAPSNVGPVSGSEINRSPSLPVELNGVSVSIGGAAAGLYFVGNSPSEIDFVVPIGLGVSGTPVDVVVNNRNDGTVIRGKLLIVPAQPDIFTTTMGAGGRAFVCNITNPNAVGCLTEPFSVMSADSTGTLVPTILQVNLSGTRNVTEASQVSIIIGSTTTTTITATAIRRNPNMPGWDTIDFTIPASLAGAGDVPIQVSVFIGSPFASRDAGTAPHITISP